MEKRFHFRYNKSYKRNLKRKGNEDDRKTSLYDFHQSHQGKLVEFADTWLPIQYPTGILKEHQAVREQAGTVRRVAHGRISRRRPGSGRFLDHLLTNKIANLKHGQMRYSCLCYENGGTVDDLIVYRFDDEHFYVSSMLPTSRKTGSGLIRTAVTTFSCVMFHRSFHKLRCRAPKRLRSWARLPI